MKAGATSDLNSDKTILTTLEEAKGDVSVLALLEQLEQKGIRNQSEVKTAIWRLIDEKKIEMTSRRELRPR